ncbi:esterase [Clostridium tertium]|uniref:esterase n=1 Tax=Clostridium TaxID=1485 RepID=UPI00232C412A|nr:MULTISPECIES: esterase [Clostridium]MDB1923396.1 esterase [Clostridium tertium]MDB1930001.1 esterase [Clostridium tertium]MDU7948693.1 esterase [Clostridium sp.]
MSVTSLENLKKIAKGQEVELLGWGEEPFVCKLKRPSMLGLVANGEIPNPLLNAAYILFNGAKTTKDVINMKEQKELLTIMAKAAMVEPTYTDLEEIGLELTDTQLLEIYNYTQIGVKALTSFRTKQQDSKNTEN